MDKPEQENQLRVVGKELSAALSMIYPTKMAFMLVLSPFNADEEEDSVVDYLGNMNEEDAINILRTTADKIELKETIHASQGNA